jgi:hypothetical protein
VAIRVGSGDHFIANVDNVAFEHGLYAVETVPGAKHGEETVERAIGPIESEFAAARDRLAMAGQLVGAADASAVLAMVASLRLRTPGALRDADTMMDGFMKAHVVRMICDRGERERAIDVARRSGTSPADAEKALDAMRALPDYRVEPSQTGRIGTMLENASVLNGIFLEMNWSIERATGARKFITSDYPVSISARKPRVGRGIGFEDRDAEVVCPLTREFAIVGRWGGFQHRAVADARVDQLNRRTAWFATRHLFAESEDARNMTYARAFTGAPRVCTEGLPSRVDDEVARRGEIEVKQYLYPVPWDPPRRDKAG